MKPSLTILLSLLTAMLLTACEKELDFKYKEIEPILVIEGTITQEGAAVSLTWTTPMNEPMNRDRLTDAAVAIADLTTGRSFELHPDAEGLYRSETAGEEGHDYRLTVEREGLTYTSESRMLPGVEITDMAFSWIKMPYDEVAVLQVSFTDDPSSSDDCYWMRLYRNGEPYKWAELTDIFAREGRIDKVTMTTRRDLEEEDEGDRLEEGDVVTATVVPVSRPFYNYLEALAVGNSNGPRMFSGPQCLGYFLAAPVASRSIEFHPDEIPAAK